MTHAEHAAQAREFIDQADETRIDGDVEFARALDRRAQFHATMAVYEAMVLPAYGMSVGDQLQQEREDQKR